MLAGTRLVTDYDKLTGQPRRYERVFWWPDRCWVEYTVEVSLGRADPVTPADPNAALQPDDTLFPSAGAVEKRAWPSEHAAQRAAETENRIHLVLARRGPLTASALCTSLALSPSAIHKALRRRPDLFAVVGEKRNRRNRPVFVWGLVSPGEGVQDGR